MYSIKDMSNVKKKLGSYFRVVAVTSFTAVCPHIYL